LKACLLIKKISFITYQRRPIGCLLKNKWRKRFKGAVTLGDVSCKSTSPYRIGVFNVLWLSPFPLLNFLFCSTFFNAVRMLGRWHALHRTSNSEGVIGSAISTSHRRDSKNVWYHLSRLKSFIVLYFGSLNDSCILFTQRRICY
jgi:hypothetical protein